MSIRIIPNVRGYRVCCSEEECIDIELPQSVSDTESQPDAAPARPPPRADNDKPQSRPGSTKRPTPGDAPRPDPTVPVRNRPPIVVRIEVYTHGNPDPTVHQDQIGDLNDLPILLDYIGGLREGTEVEEVIIDFWGLYEVPLWRLRELHEQVEAPVSVRLFDHME